MKSEVNSTRWFYVYKVLFSAIQCNASKFKDIDNGFIVNYTSIYGYLEYMELQCDDGYRPIDGIDSAVCFRTSSFSEMYLPKFGCQGAY